MAHLAQQAGLLRQANFGQVLAWSLVIVYLLRVRVRVDESATLPGLDGSPWPAEGSGVIADSTTVPSAPASASSDAPPESADTVIASILGDES